MNRMSEKSVNAVFGPYIGYVLNFVGAGMVSGGVVHYPLDENFYGLLTVIGSVVFTLGALLTEIVNKRKLGNFFRVLFLILISLLLSFGIGMLSGGIQHFTDFPNRATVLIPAGLLLSYLSFCLKYETFNRRQIKKTAIGFSVVAIISGSAFFSLTALASTISTSGHSHSTAEDSHQELPEQSVTPTPTETEESNATSPSDGHANHNH